MASTLEVLCMLLLIKVTSCITGPAEVTGGVGETVRISCQYAQFYRDKVKYWCRGYHWYFCSVVVRSDQPPPKSPAQSAVLLSDNKHRGEFTVDMRRVTEQDSDWYWCAIETASRGVGVRVQLMVSKWYVTQLPTTTTSGEVIETTSPSPSTSSSSHFKTSSATTETHFLLCLSNSANSCATSGPNQLHHPLWIEVWVILRWVLVLALFLVAMICAASCRRRRIHPEVT